MTTSPHVQHYCGATPDEILQYIYQIRESDYNRNLQIAILMLSLLGFTYVELNC